MCPARVKDGEPDRPIMGALGSTGRDRVMLMHDRPPTADFAKANGQASRGALGT